MDGTEARKQFKIVVVGAGIAGLSAAIGLHLKGHDVTVLERHADTQGLGGPISMSPSATHILTDYGLKDRIHEHLNPVEKAMCFRRFEDGRQLGSAPPQEMVKLYGSGVWTCSRFRYQKILREAAEERKIKVEFSSPIETVDVQNTTVLLRDGRRLKADLIVAADGAGSRTRRVVAGDHLERRNPVGAVNIDVPLSLMRDDPDLAVLAEENQCFWVGPGGACAAGAVRDLGLYNMGLTSDEEMGAKGEWFIKGDLSKIAEKRKDWDPRLLKIISLAKPEDCYVWNINDLPSLPTWSKSNTILIGDAAHATLPFLGMGATLSVEDGAALAECLNRTESVEDIPRILKAFETLRKTRAEAVIRFSRDSMNAWHLPDGEQQAQRDKFWASMNIYAPSTIWDRKPLDEPPSTLRDPLLQPYFKGHKTVEYTNRKLDEMGLKHSRSSYTFEYVR